MKLRLYYILFWLILASCNRNKKLILENKISNDSINYWINSSNNNLLNNNKKKLYLTKALNKINISKNDSLKLQYLNNIAYQFYKLEDTVQFINLTNRATELATRVKDSFVLGDAHWNYGSFFIRKDAYDSAYYHFNLSQKFFNKNPYYLARVLTSKAYIKSEFGDYLGSEALIIEAIKIFKVLKLSKFLSSSYNNLGVIQKQMNNYDKALFYYNKALVYQNNKILKEKKYTNIYNNIAIVYQKKEEYEKALLYFRKSFSENLKNKYPDQYALLLDNIAYTKFLKTDTIGVFRDLKKALLIRDSINNNLGIITSKLHLGEYYFFLRDTTKAYHFTKQAHKLAKKVKNSSDYLSSLRLLAKVDKNNAKQYLNEYIECKDSLQEVQLRFQNKFARISYETDEYIEETNYLKKRQQWLLIIGLACIFIISLLYVLKIQHSKNQKLILETEQQKLNEELYLLALKRQERLESVKIKERNRISEELHDNVLSRLFGVRVSFDFMNLELENKESKKYNILIKELQDIEVEIRNLSHQLSDNIESSRINFKTLIEQLLINTSIIGNFKYEFKHGNEFFWEEISPLIKVNLYRILQEALQNIISHAQATFVIVTVTLKTSSLEIKVEDNGVGFDITRENKGIGLRNMKSRVQKIKGTIVFESDNSGTSICISIPLKKSYYD